MAQHQTQPTAASAVEVDLSVPAVAFVMLSGEHDLSTTLQLSEALERASARRDVFVDLSECTFIDSSVIGECFRARTKLELRDGGLELIIPPGTVHAVRHVAELSGLGAIMRIHESPSAALSSLRTGEHIILVRDLRARFGDTESYVAECSCGWAGNTHTGWRTAARTARRDGAIHVDEHRGSPTGARRTR